MSAIPGFYTLSEAAAELGKSHSTVARYVRRGLLAAKVVAGSYLIEQSEVLKFTPPPVGNPNFRPHDTTQDPVTQ